VRAVVESAGIHDILSKCLGSSNKYNVVHATIAALQGLRSPEIVANARSKQVEEIASDYPVAAVSASASGASSIVSSSKANSTSGSAT
jgi:hypothetical protein